MTLDEIRKVVEAATPGPWWAEQDDVLRNGWDIRAPGDEEEPPRQVTSGDVGIGAISEHGDAAFIAMARNVMPKLIAVAEAAKLQRDFGRDYCEPHSAHQEIKDALAALESLPK